MHDWPTNGTPLCFLAGIPPLVYVFVKAFFGMNQEGFSLRFWGVLFLWLGYHFGPLLLLFEDNPVIFMLVPRYIDECLLFSALCMYAYLAGYRLFMRSSGNETSRRKTDLVLPSVPPAFLIVMASFVLIHFLISVGGFEEALVSSRTTRYEGEWDVRDFQGKLAQMLGVLTGFIGLALACITSIFLLDTKYALRFRLALGISCLVVASLNHIFIFGRASGLSLGIFAIILLNLKGSRAAPIAVPCFVMAAFLGGVGMNYRGVYTPGLYNFAEACIESIENSGESGEAWTITADNFPLNAVDPWTLVADIRKDEAPSPSDQVFPFLLSLNPLPSEFIPVRQVGPDLADVMGSTGAFGLTTPACAEIYYAFGFWGFLSWIPLGMVYAFFDSYRFRKGGVIASVCFLLCLASFPIGGHSRSRSMTRPIEYAGILLLVASYAQKHSRALIPAPLDTMSRTHEVPL